MPMSSSPLLDDADAATLAAVLSFLDSADELSVGIAEPLHTPLGRREESGAVKYTTQHQRKKRAEITALRGQVEELEARLTHLQTVQRASLSSSSPRLPGSTEEQALWQEVALDERAKRLRAEQANRRLKEVAKHYRELGDAILGVLRKRRCPEDGCQILLGTPEPPRFPTLTVKISAPMMDAMRQGMARLLFEAPNVFPAVPSSRITSSFETVRAPSGVASFVEIRTATPVQFSSVETSDRIWRSLSTSSLRIYAHKRHAMIPSRDGRSVEKKFVMMVPSPVEKHPFANELGVRVTGMHLIQRYGPYADGTSIVVTSAVVIFPPHGRVFREHKWIKVSPLSPGSSSPTAVLETCYRVYPGECQPSSKPDDEDREAAFYLRTLSANTRLVMQRDQNAQLAGEMFYQASP